MRILKLELIRFGCFTGVTLDFSRPGLSIVYGDNEAGKSTALRAVEGALFGIPHSTQDGHVHPQHTLELGFVAEHQTETLDLIRRKGNKNTLLEGAGRTPAAEKRVVAMLGGIHQELFRSLFGLDHKRLRQGGQNLLAGESELSGLLFGAALGASTATVLRDQLLEGARELYSQRGKKQAIPALLRRLRDAHERMRETMVAPESYERLANELTDTIKRVEHAAVDLEERRSELGRLERLDQAHAPWDELQALRNDRAELRGVVSLRRDEVDAAHDALREHDRLVSLAKRCEAEERRLQAELDRIETCEPLLGKRDQIEQLTREHHTCLEIRAKLPELVSRRDQAARQINHFSARLEITNLDAVSSMPIRVERELQRLARDRARLDGERESTHAHLRSLTARKLECGRQLADLPLPTDAAAIEGTLERFRASGDLETRVIALRRRQDELNFTSQRLREVLGIRTELVLSESVVPSVPVMRRFDALLTHAQAEISDRATTLAEIERQVGSIEAKLDVLRFSGPLPTELDLRAARTQRDENWRQLRPVVRNERRSAETDLEVADALEASIREADQLADDLRTEADRISMARQLRATLASLQTDRSVVQAELAPQRTSLEGLEEQWRALWSPIGVIPESPIEMIHWRADFERLMANLDERSGLDRDLAATSRELLRIKTELYASLLDVEAVAAGEYSPKQLIDAAAHWLNEERQTAAVRTSLESRLAALRGDIAEHQAHADAGSSSFEAWTGAWNHAVKELPVRSTGEVVTVLESLAGLSDLRSAMDAHRAFHAETEVAQRRLDAFRDSAADLCKGLGRGVGSDPLRAVEDLASACQKAVEASNARRQLATERDRHATEKREVAVALQEQLERIQALAARGGLADISTFESALADWTTWHALDTRIRDLERQLSRLCAPEALSVIEVRLQELDPSALAAGRHAIQEELARLEGEHTAGLRSVGELQGQLRVLGSDGSAAARNQEVQEVLAEIDRAVAEFVEARVAGALLTRAIDIYRERNQAPVVCRAGELFAIITCGSFAGLCVDIGGEDEPELCAVRPGGTKATVDELSDGARDQLYLALRLAFIENHLRDVGPVPVVFDDIFVNFDDNRTAAGLRALGELAAHTQVIVFTHHWRVAELARRAIPDVCLIPLDRRESTGHSATNASHELVPESFLS